MAILHADNFSIYGTNAALMLNGIYAASNGSLINDPDGISGGKVFQMGHGSNSFSQTLRYAFQNGATMTAGAAVRMWLYNLPPNDTKSCYPITLASTGNEILVTLKVASNGALILTCDSIEYRTPVPVVTANGWYHIEGKFSLTAGAPKYTMDVEIRVEGQTVLELNDISAPAAAFGQFSPATHNNSDAAHTFPIKDLVIWDGSGTQNNNFLGSVLVTTLTVASDVSLNWTPSTGSTGAPILDNIPPNDTQYIVAEDLPLPAPYVGVLTDLPAETTSVKALISFVRASKSDGGDGSLQTSLISSPDDAPATVDGSNRPITVAATYWRDIFELDPKTGAPWLPGSVNAAQIKINRTT